MGVYDEIYEAYLAKHPEKQARYAQNSTIQPEAVSDKGEADEGPESRLQGKCERYCREHGYPFVHDRSRGCNRSGEILDLIVALPGGRTVYIELKSKTGRMSKEQEQTVLKLQRLGHEVYPGVKSYRRFIEIIQAGK